MLNWTRHTFKPHRPAFTHSAVSIRITVKTQRWINQKRKQEVIVSIQDAAFKTKCSKPSRPSVRSGFNSKLCGLLVWKFDILVPEVTIFRREGQSHQSEVDTPRSRPCSIFQFTRPGIIIKVVTVAPCWLLDRMHSTPDTQSQTLTVNTTDLRQKLIF